jgi:hypothetical protein
MSRDKTGTYIVFMGMCDVKELLEDVDVDGRIILNWSYKNKKEKSSWIYVAKYRG